MLKKGLTIGIIVLFIASSLATMVVGYNAEPVEIDKQLADLAIICREPNGFNSVKYEHYKQKLIRQHSSEDNYESCVVKPENIVVQIESKLSPLSFSTVSGGPMDSAWPMQSHDIHHTGQSPYSTSDNPGIEKWRFYMDGWMEDTPVIDKDATIYFGGCYGGLPWYLFAIYEDGTEKWKYKTGDLILGSSPAIADDGTIYVGSWDFYLHAISSDGTLKWKYYANGADISSSPAIAEDGTIYFGTLWSLGDGGKIHAVNPNGTEKWHYQTGYAILSAPAIGEDGTIYIGSCDGYLYALWPNGTLRWRFHTDDEIHGDPAIGDDGTIYIGSWDDYFYAINPDGSQKWKFSGLGNSNSAAIGTDGIIYVATDRFFALYANGTAKWGLDLGPHADKSSPAISSDGIIYVGAATYILAIDLNGNEKWRKKLADEWVQSSPSIAEDGTVYIGSSVDMSRGYLHAFGAIESNSPPDAPSISGPSRVKIGEDNWYIFTAIDPDNNPIQLYVDWGDGNSGWVGEYASGEQMWIEKAWNAQGTYQVKAKVKDVMGEESGWGYLEVTVPMNLQQIIKINSQQINQQSSNQLILKMFQRLLLNIR